MLNKKIYYFTFLLVVFLAQFLSTAYGQGKLKLTDVKAITFITKGGGLSNNFKKIAIVNENGLWKSYQLRLVTINKKMEYINDSVRAFIKIIDEQKLADFLKIIEKKDTTITPKKFNLNSSDLVDLIDTIIPGLNKSQKKEFKKGIYDRHILSEALYTVLHPRPMDDKTYYGITITTNSGKVINVKAYSFAGLYDLPWNIDQVEIYDPKISLFFRDIMGDGYYAAYEKKYMLKDVLKEIYSSNFLVAFNWADLKTNYYESYKLFNKTLIPVDLYTHRDNSITEERYISALFKSALLPEYIRLQSRFAFTDTAAIIALNKYEHTIDITWKHSNFLFDYLKGKSGFKMMLGPEKFSHIGERIFHEIAKYYTEIKNFDYRESQLLTIYDNKNLNSHWILLPNNQLILLDYIGELLPDGKIKFMNLIIDPTDNFRFLHTRYVCIVFNESGEIIQNYGQAFISSNLR